jgi:hypothetical protein
VALAQAVIPATAIVAQSQEGDILPPRLEMASAHARFIDQRDLAKLDREVLNSRRKARKNAELEPALAYAGGTPDTDGRTTAAQRALDDSADRRAPGRTRAWVDHGVAHS